MLCVFSKTEIYRLALLLQEPVRSTFSTVDTNTLVLQAFLLEF